MEGLGLTGATATGQFGDPGPRVVTILHGAQVAIASGHAGHISLFRFAEGNAASPVGQLQGVGDRNVSGGESVACHVGRSRELSRDQAKTALEHLQCKACAPVPALGLGCEIAAGIDEVDGCGEAGFAEVKELLIRGVGRIVEAGANGVGPWRAIRYSMIAIDSTIVTSPSRMAGMKPAGLMARNSASFSTPASRSTRLKLYGSRISSNSQTIRNPLPSPKTVIMSATPCGRTGWCGAQRTSQPAGRP